jgi:murein hydrolase activator
MTCRLSVAGWLLVLLASTAQAQTADSLNLPDTNTVALDSEIARNQSELGQTRARLEQVRGQLDELGAQERSTLGKIDAYAERISLTQRLVRQLGAQAQARRREVATVAGQIERTTARIGQRKRDLGRRLTTIYKYGRTFSLDALISSQNLAGLYRKLVYLRWIARADRRLADDLAALSLSLEQQRQRVIAAQADIARLQDEQARQQATLTAAQVQERTLLRTIRTQSAGRESLRVQLQTAADRLSALIAGLEARRASRPGAGTDFQNGRGKLPWPIRGTIIAGYGTQTHPKYGTKTTSLGIDIKATPGASVLAVAAGHVAYADQFMGYGNLVIVDHGGGFYTLYGNLDQMAVAVGRDLPAGQSVGTSRDYVHFEVRKDGKPVDPMNWLGK